MFVPQRPTALAKILGVYRIGYKNSQNNTEKKLDLLVMENLFYGRKMAQVSSAPDRGFSETEGESFTDGSGFCSCPGVRPERLAEEPEREDGLGEGELRGGSAG